MRGRHSNLHFGFLAGGFWEQIRSRSPWEAVPNPRDGWKARVGALRLETPRSRAQCWGEARAADGASACGVCFQASWPDLKSLVELRPLEGRTRQRLPADPGQVHFPSPYSLRSHLLGSASLLPAASTSHAGLAARGQVGATLLASTGPVLTGGLNCSAKRLRLWCPCV